MNNYMFVNNIPGTWAGTWAQTRMKHDATSQLFHTAKHCAEKGSQSQHLIAYSGTRQDKAKLAGQGSGLEGEGENVKEMEPDCRRGKTVGISETWGDMVEEVAGGSEVSPRENTVKAGIIPSMSACVQMCLG